jgi:TRAP-type uncharacterized transport system fused permease subunit
MGPLEVAVILFGVFGVLVVLRVPVAFALGLAVVPVFFIDERLTPILLLREMFKSYNAFVLLAVPFFLLAANLMNAAGITDRLIRLARELVGHLPGGLGHVNVVVSMLFAGISGSSTADASGIGSLLIPQMKKEGYDTSFAVAITACSSVMGVIIHGCRRPLECRNRSHPEELAASAASLEGCRGIDPATGQQISCSAPAGLIPPFCARSRA